MKAIGIDPGLGGAIAIIDEFGIIELIDMPTNNVKNCKRINSKHIFKLLSSHRQAIASIEKVSSRPGQGVVSTFTFGQGYGSVISILECLDIRFDTPTPGDWQSHFKLEKPVGALTKSQLTKARKQLHANTAASLFPRAELTTKRGRLLDGRADALLIARYTLDKSNYKRVNDDH